MTPIIVAKNVSFTYPAGVTALKNINLEINKGEIVAIIGQNGSGKTTLVKHFNGLLKPTKGQVIINDEDTKKAHTAKLSRIVGYVFQDPDDQIFTNKVIDEVGFGPKNLKLSRKEVRKRVKQALETTGLWNKRGEHPLDLNINEKKFTCIASIIAMNPEVIILDEATSGQDHEGIKKVRKLIKELNKNHTIILISHNMELVASVAKRVIIMCDGKKLFEGTPRQAFVKNKLLNQTYLKPPFITQLAQKTRIRKDVLTINELVQEL